MTPRTTHELAAFIRRTREQSGLSQAGLARTAGIPRTTLIHIETGELGTPDPAKLQRIARALDIDAEDLFALADYASPSKLPTFGPYLRARWGDELPPEARERLVEYFEMLRQRYGEDGDGQPDR